MFKIFAVLCLMNIGELGQDLCFKTQVPLNFNNTVECQTTLNKLVDYLDADLKEREVTIIFGCKEDLQKINI